MPRRPDEIAINCTIGANIRLHRLRRGWTLDELGQVLGLSYQQVQKFELGKDRIAASQLLIAAHALGVVPAELLEGTFSCEMLGSEVDFINSG